MALAACTTPQSLLLSLLPDGTFLVPLSKLLGTENRNRERLLDLEERGDWAAVVATADAELQKNTQSAEWHYIRGMGEARRGNWRSAQGSFAHSVRLDPNELEGWYMLARAQVSSGERENAVRTLERALDVDRANPLT